MKLYIPSMVAVVPEPIVSILGLVLTGLAEKRFVPRGTVLLNIFFLWQLLITKTVSDKWVILYLNLSIVFFVLSLYSFLSHVVPSLEYKSLHPLVHDLNYLLYSSKTILGATIATLLGFGFGGVAIVSVILLVLSIKYLGHEYPFQT